MDTEKIKKLADKLSEMGDKENSDFLLTLCNDASTVDTGKTEGLSDSEMKILTSKLKQAAKDEDD